ncbi:hypothetical protein PSTT_06618 [Puccinia striiformis]|uniref:Uncharacterized protein n=1 Tax=Puccinia striiformis TaxID=27350 RepID=A0A2S4VJS5_9BASI|nr:hypothetical protein PSTT_06618 [Puccinia striiformis]
MAAAPMAIRAMPMATTSLGGRIYGGGALGLNLLGGGGLGWGNSIYGSAYLNGNPLLSLSGGLGIYLKDAPDAGKTHADNSA